MWAEAMAAGDVFIVLMGHDPAGEQDCKVQLQKAFPVKEKNLELIFLSPLRCLCNGRKSNVDLQHYALTPDLLQGTQLALT